MTWKRYGAVTFHYSFEDNTCAKLHIQQYGKTLTQAILLWKYFTDNGLAIWDPVHDRYEGKTGAELLTWLQNVDANGQTHVTLLTCMDRPDEPEEDEDG